MRNLFVTQVSQTYKTALVLVTPLLALLFLGVTQAQDPKPGAGDKAKQQEQNFTPVAAPVWTTTTTPDGYTIWKRTINSGCLFTDHSYILNVPANPADMWDVSYSMSNYDVDYRDPLFCPLGPEVDLMYLNGNPLGSLVGGSQTWSVNKWPINSSQVVNGPNNVYINTDSTHTGCWCVGVGTIQVKARLGFQVTGTTPPANDKNRDFHVGKLNLTVSFSQDYQPASLTNATFKLEYRDQLRVWQSVAGSFSQLSSKQFGFVPDQDLKDGVRYRVTVKGGQSGVMSSTGRTLAKDTQWYFVTVPDLSINDAYDYGSSSVCAPSASPCPGLELAVFQVARNAPMVPGKPAVARLYLRWKTHPDVLPTDQVTFMNVDAKVTVDGKSKSGYRTVKRPDLYQNNFPAQITAGKNTINSYQTAPRSFNYQAEVTPRPQTNATEMKYTQALNLVSSAHTPMIEFDYWFLKDGDWKAEVPAAAIRNGLQTLNAGRDLITDMFPVLKTTLTPKGEFSIGYTRTVTVTGVAGTIWMVNCPKFSPPVIEEWDCVFRHMALMRGGNKFVAATVPSSLEPTATGFAIGDQVFMHQYPTSANDATVAHEVGHIYGISTANNPTDGHRNDSHGVEGFQVSEKTNRSFVENPTKAVSLMHTTVQPQGTQWVDNTDYATLQGTVTLLRAPVSAVPYLIVSGSIDTGANSVLLATAFMQNVPNDPPDATGACSASLLDNSNVTLSSANFAPKVVAPILEGSQDASQAPAAGIPAFFSVSVPWNASAQKLRIACNSTTLITVTRSAHAPAADFIGLANGTTLSGTTPINWSGSDADGDGIDYQLQYSQDSGATWSPLQPVATNTSLTFDTRLLPAGPNNQLRLMATDGFNTSFVTRSVTLLNPLAVVGVLPSPDATNVSLDEPVKAIFATAVNTTSLDNTSFVLLQSDATVITGAMSYAADERAAILVPALPLQPATIYTVTLQLALQDINGNALDAPHQWSFTTVSDTVPPEVSDISPGYGDADVPLNSLVQADFSKAMNPTTINNATFKLLDGANTPIAGAVSYNADIQAAVFIPSAPLLAGADYTAVVTTGTLDLVGNAPESPWQWTFTTGVLTTSTGLRIVGNIDDQAGDANADGTYNNLTLLADVEVSAPGTYNLNGRLLDKTGQVIDWQSTGDLALSTGVHRLALVFPSGPIGSDGVDGPYTLDSLNFYDTVNTDLSDSLQGAYHTSVYSATSFHKVNDLAVQQLLNSGVVLPGEIIQYYFELKNAGNAPANNIIITDTLPAGTVYVTHTGQFTYYTSTVSSNQVVWMAPSLMAGRTTYFYVTAYLPPGLAPGALLTNTVSATNGRPDDHPIDNTSVLTEAVLTPLRDLRVDLYPQAGILMAGRLISYELSISNHGNITATNVLVTDTLPLALSYSGSTSSGFYGGASSGPFTPAVNGNLVVWNLGALPRNSGGILSIGVWVTDTLAAEILVTNTVNIGGAENDANPADNQSIYAASSQSPTRDAALSLSVVQGYASPGSNMVYRIFYGNSGNAPLAGVVITDTLPDLLQLISFSGPVTPTIQGRTLSWAIGALAGSGDNGSNGNVYVTARVPATATLGAIFTDLAGITTTSQETATILNPNLDSVLYTVGPPVPQMSVVKSLYNSTFTSGSEVTYEIDYGNTSASAAPDAWLTDTLPSGMVYARSSGAINPTVNGGKITWRLGLVQGNTYNGLIYVVGYIPPNTPAGTVMTNTVIISDAFDIPYNLYTTSYVRSTVISATRDLTLSLSLAYGVPLPGGLIYLDQSYRNLGQATARGALLTETLPAGASVELWSGPFTPTVNGNTVVWSLGTVPGAGLNGSNVDLYLGVRISNGLAVGAVLTTNAVIGAIDPDTNLANNMAHTTQTLVAPTRDLRVQQSLTSDWAQPGREITYTINFGNYGNSIAAGSLLTDTLPVSTTFARWDNVAFTTNVLTPSLVGRALVWTLGNIPGSGGGTLDIVARVSDDVQGGVLITNVVTTSTTSPELDYTNNAATDAHIAVIPDAYEPDDTPLLATPISVHGIRQTHNFHKLGDQDWMVFPTTIGLTYTLQTTTTAYTFMYLYDSDRQTLLGYDDHSGGGSASKIMWRANHNGNLFVAVENQGYTYGPATQYQAWVIEQGPLIHRMCLPVTLR